MATIPQPHTWSTGDTVRAEHFNTYLRDAYAFLLNRPVVHLSSSAAQSTSGASNTLTLQWDTEDINTDGMFSSSSNTRITCQTEGLYEIILHVDWQPLDAEDSTTRKATVAWSTAAGIPSAIGVDQFRPTHSDTASPQVNHVVCTKYMEVGDYLVASVVNTDDTTLDTAPTIESVRQGYLTFFSACWMGAS